MGSRIVGLLGAIVMSVLGGIVDSRVQAGEISVAAASDMNFAFKEIVAEFEKKTGNTVRLSLGSSGNFFAQISNGAPFDLYFSADISYPKKLEEAGLAEPGTLYSTPSAGSWFGFQKALPLMSHRWGSKPCSIRR